jgi:hypothetical protein
MGGCQRWFLALVGLAPACVEPPPPSLHLLEFRQQGVNTVALNEELTFFFSGPLDASSVTSESVRVLDEDGFEARGERRVRGNALTFLPDLPRASDLSDGGFRPGRRYRAILAGFPCPDGLRSLAGGFLSAGLVLEFATAGAGDPAPMFLDAFRGPFRLQPRGRSSRAVELEDGRLVLEYGEALEPSSVPASRFLLSRATPGAPELTIRARLIENRRDYAALELSPVGPDGTPLARLPGGKYYLSLAGNELRTLGGREVPPGWPALMLSVPPERIALDLGARGALSGELPAGCDGSARLEPDRGMLRLRFPAAAGDGRAGSLRAEELGPERDLHATRIEVEADRTVDLSTLSGPVVLRSQGLLCIRGRLVRRGTSTAARIGGAEVRDPPTEELERLSEREARDWAPLSPWLARLIEPGQSWANEPWTVLIAGGDLWIPAGGSLEVDGNLVLVAGGRIRVEGRAVSHADLWSSEGGQNIAARRNSILPLTLDEPRTNPLRAPLVVGVLTRAHPRAASGDLQTWLFGHGGRGRLAAALVEEPISSPIGVSAPSAVRFLIRLEVGPGAGEPWDPPLLERLEVEGLAPLPGPAPERP